MTVMEQLYRKISTLQASRLTYRLDNKRGLQTTKKLQVCVCV